jgi:hypothetical protein
MIVSFIVVNCWLTLTRLMAHEKLANWMPGSPTMEHVAWLSSVAPGKHGHCLCADSHADTNGEHPWVV